MTFDRMTFDRMPLNKMKLNRMPLSKMKLNRMKLSLTKPSIIQQNIEFRRAEGCGYYYLWLSPIKLVSLSQSRREKAFFRWIRLFVSPNVWIDLYNTEPDFLQDSDCYH